MKEISSVVEDMNMNMKVIYYFIVYAELRYVNAKVLPYVKRLYSVTPYLPSRVTEKVGFSCY